MLRRSRLKVTFVIAAFVILVLYNEVVSYINNSRYWVPVPDNAVNFRVLFVADPQIPGETNELPFLGLFTRWDADRYLTTNFLLAKEHVKPHVIVFLGDLFDEGSTAEDTEYRRYYARFASIFKLPRKQDPSPIEYIFLPGDNDIGGEGMQAVDPIKLRWFNQTFGDHSKPKKIYLPNKTVVQFLNVNLMLPQDNQHFYLDKGSMNNNVQSSNNEVNILLSHIPISHFIAGERVKKILQQSSTSIVFSAHSHISSYAKFNKNESLGVVYDFLALSRSPNGKIDEDANVRNGWLNLPISRNVDPREITVPTCSYRMGVPEMGYGVLILDERQKLLQYTVLWLPSRFKQLYLYLASYFLLKASLILYCITCCASIALRKICPKYWGSEKKNSVKSTV